MKINPNRGLYIKLGDKGRFERDCILNDQVIRLQYELISHDMCLRGEWNAVTAEVLKVYSTDPGAASNRT